MNNEDFSIVSSSEFFDAEWYLTQYPEVVQSEMLPVEHYINYGALELRNPGPLFDTAWYLKKNPDVFAMKINPLVHFIRFGAKEGRDSSPFALIRRKISISSISEGATGQLFNAYASSSHSLPDRASSENWEIIRQDWTNYFLSKGAISFQLGDVQQSLRYITSGIQVNSDNIDGYALFLYTFRTYNQKEIELFENCFAGAKLLVVHMSCQARVMSALKSTLSFYDENNQIANVIVVGDSSLPEYKFDFDPHTNILKVPSGDYYEGLPMKIRNFFLFFGFTTLEMPVLKVDDDIHCACMAKLKRNLQEVILKNDYGGFIVPKKPFFHASYWHLKKCTDPVLNTRPDSLLLVAPFATGPTYWLSSQAANALSKIALIHERHFETEIYEDRAVGAALAVYGFNAHQFSFIDSGSLKSTDSYY